VIYIYERTEMMTVSPTATTVQLLNQKDLQKVLGLGKWSIDQRIARYPEGHPNAFPVEYLGRFRRFDPEKVRAWFARERAGFPHSNAA
jgi:hypothetical protein